jgi:hypothetical protein
VRKSIVGWHWGQLIVVWCLLLGSSVGFHFLAKSRLSALSLEDTRPAIDIFRMQAEGLERKLENDGMQKAQANDSAVRLLRLRLESPDSKAGKLFDQLPLDRPDLQSGKESVDAAHAETLRRRIKDLLLGERIQRVQAWRGRILFWTVFKWASVATLMCLGLGATFVWFGGRPQS